MMLMTIAGPYLSGLLTWLVRRGCINAALFAREASSRWFNPADVRAIFLPGERHLGNTACIADGSRTSIGTLREDPGCLCGCR